MPCCSATLMHDLLRRTRSDPPATPLAGPFGSRYRKLMIQSLLSAIGRMLIALVLIGAMAGTGFAHRTQAADDPDLLAFLETGAALTDICAHDGRAPHDAAMSCDACRLIGSALIARHQPIDPFCATHLILARCGLQGDLHLAAAFDLSRPVRAPPMA